jgi:membrane associated rhomboid family serine protease
MPRYPSRYSPSSFSFGPGPLSTALKALIGANVAMFLAMQFLPEPATIDALGLIPRFFLTRLWVWQPVTYMFLHDPSSVFHILFNMLALWMFGAELEGIWGTRYFLKFYFVTGVGAGLLTVLISLLPFGSRSSCSACIIGAWRGLRVALAYGM